MEKLGELHAQAREILGEVPSRVLVNKSDLALDPMLHEALAESDFDTHQFTSAKTGENVAEAFHNLAIELAPSGAARAGGSG